MHVSVNRVCGGFGAKTAVARCCEYQFDVDFSECVGLVGHRKGCKSTLPSSATGLQSAFAFSGSGLEISRLSVVRLVLETNTALSRQELFEGASDLLRSSVVLESVFFSA